MNEQLKLLVDLQEIDSIILSYVEKVELHPKKLDQFKIPLNQAQDAFHKFKTTSDVLTKKKKDKDIALDELQDKINKVKAKSGEIKTNKGYEAHLKEVESFEKNKYMIEDEILNLMEDIEKFADEITKEGAKVKEAEAEFNKQEKLINEEKSKLESELETLRAKRKDFSSKLDDDIYTQYKTLLKRLGGLAVVETKDEFCFGCHTNIPPQLYNDIKETGDIHKCYYCKRFLYFKDSDQSDNKPQEAPTPS